MSFFPLTIFCVNIILISTIEARQLHDGPILKPNLLEGHDLSSWPAQKSPATNSNMSQKVFRNNDAAGPLFVKGQQVSIYRQGPPSLNSQQNLRVRSPPKPTKEKRNGLDFIRGLLKKINSKMKSKIAIALNKDYVATPVQQYKTFGIKVLAPKSLRTNFADPSELPANTVKWAEIIPIQNSDINNVPNPDLEVLQLIAKDQAAEMLRAELEDLSKIESIPNSLKALKRGSKILRRNDCPQPTVTCVVYPVVYPYYTYYPYYYPYYAYYPYYGYYGRR